MITTVVFDIGNVLADFVWQPYLQSLFEEEETIRAVTAAIFGTGLWAEFDRGVLPEEEIIRRMLQADPKYREEISLALARSGECIVRMDYAIPWVRELKARGYRVLFLSNYSERLRRLNPDALDFLPEMEGGVFSDQVKLLKPDRAIYVCLCDRYGLVPAETVFLDDNADNISAARAFGMHAIRFTGYEAARRELEDELGL